MKVKKRKTFLQFFRKIYYRGECLMLQENTSRQNFSEIIEKKIKNGRFIRFDDFICHYLGYTLEHSEAKEEKIRKQSYRKFLQCVGLERPASLPTIRRWFGIHGFKEPSREQVIRIAFSLKLSVKETEEFLMEGIREPSFQICDYTEIIAMYCLERCLGYPKYSSMIDEYEKHLESQQQMDEGFNTNWLFQQFEHIKSLPEEEFMYWMWVHSRIFKGYSRTVQEYLEKYRSLVLEDIRQNMKERLGLLLSETGYASWREKKHSASGAREWEFIKKYIYRSMKSGKEKISEHLGENILELARLAYSEAGLNTSLMSELFLVPEHSAATQELPENTIKIVSSKYLSDLFNIPDRNRKIIRGKGAIRELESMGPEEPCPETVRAIISDCSRGTLQIENSGEALEWLKEFVNEGKRRRLIVKRGDLLPMILYVSQKNYRKEEKETGQNYDCKKALKKFQDLANATMIACNMSPLNEAYMFDMILLACFQKDEMYGYQDVLELV